MKFNVVFIYTIKEWIPKYNNSFYTIKNCVCKNIIFTSVKYNNFKVFKYIQLNYVKKIIMLKNNSEIHLIHAIFIIKENEQNFPDGFYLNTIS